MVFINGAFSILEKLDTIGFFTFVALSLLVGSAYAVVLTLTGL